MSILAKLWELLKRIILKFMKIMASPLTILMASGLLLLLRMKTLAWIVRLICYYICILSWSKQSTNMSIVWGVITAIITHLIKLFT